MAGGSLENTLGHFILRLGAPIVAGVSGRMHLGVGLLAVLLLAGCVSAHPGSPNTGTPRSGPAGLTVGTTHQELISEGARRSFAVYRPAASAPPSGYPLVVMLHGGFGDGAQAEEAYGWDGQAEQAGFLVAYPDGLNHAWNAGGDCCGRPGRQGVNDTAFLEAMVARIETEARVDPDRVYVTGMSNGAMMAYRLACESEIFAAIAPVAGNQLVDCADAKPLSVLHIHGADDTRVRLDGGRGEGIARISGPPVPAVIEEWRARDSCGVVRTATSGLVTTSIAGCAHGRTVELIVVAGAGHQWPGSAAKGFPGADPPSTALSATATIWSFFAAHPRG